MSSPAAAVATNQGRYYQLTLPPDLLDQTPATVKRSGDTIWLPSVTNILDAAAKPALIWWSAGEVASAVFTDPAHTQTLVATAHNSRVIAGDQPCKACGQPTDNLLEDKGWWIHAACYDPWRQLRKTFNDRRLEAADRGSFIHNIVERHVLGDPVNPDDYGLEAGYARSWLRFVDKHAPSFEMAEATVFNLEYGYAGTLDLIVDVGGQRWLVDVKTSPRVYESHALQLSAYRRAEHVYVDAGQVAALPSVDECAVLLLGEDSYKFKPVEVDEATFGDGFLSLLRFHGWLSSR